MKKLTAIALLILALTFVFTACGKEDGYTTTETTTYVPQKAEIVSSYDEKNKTLKTEYKDANGDVKNIDVIQYNDKKQVISEIQYDGDNGLISKKTNKYDENGNIIEMTVYKTETEINYVNKDYKYKKITTEKGEKYIELEYSQYDEKGKLNAVFKKEYDENNNCTAFVSYSPDGKEITRNDF